MYMTVYFSNVFNHFLANLLNFTNFNFDRIKFNFRLAILENISFIFRLSFTSIYLSQAIEGMKNTKCYCCLFPSSCLHTPSAWVNIDKEREKCQEKRTSFDLPSKSSALVNTPREKCRGWPFDYCEPVFLSSRPMSVYGSGME